MPKLGKKQSVLKQGISRKRKGFKGVQKQAKRAASATSERRVNITFVGEDDVVSEMIPPPAIPVSARKIGACAIDTSLWDESIPDDLEIAEGYCASAKHAIMEKVGLTVSDTAKMEARRRDSERIKQAEKRVQDQHKKYRVSRRQAKQHNEDLRIRGEGVTYAAGAFGEIEPCNGPKKRKTTQKTKK